MQNFSSGLLVPGVPEILDVEFYELYENADRVFAQVALVYCVNLCKLSGEPQPFHDFVELGGLMAYSINQVDIYRRVANLIDTILRGANPGDIPFYEPTTFELSINLKTAKTLGFEMPAMPLGSADGAIE